MALSPKLLALIACPVDKGPLLHFATDALLYNPRLRRQYRIDDGVPVLLESEVNRVDVVATRSAHGARAEVIDTHCHLDVPRFDADRAEVLHRAWSAGLEAIIIPAIGPDAWDALLQEPARDRRVQVGLGIHPQLLPELPEGDDERHLARLDALLSKKIAIAVGECGLDGPTAERVPMERQLRVTRAHLELARKHALPVLFHCLRAQPDLQKLLKSEPPVPSGIILHSFSGSADLVRQYLRHGCFISFAGPVTFTEARRPLDALRAVPLDRLLVETDAPDQAPHPHRGERCEPAHLPLTIAAMAKARAEPEDVVRDAVTKNARALFHHAWK